jgi:hypothetical protein
MSWENLLKREVGISPGTQYATRYFRYIISVLEKEGGAAGMQAFLDNKKMFGDGFSEDRLKKYLRYALENKSWLREHEFGDYILVEKNLGRD